MSKSTFSFAILILFLSVESKAQDVWRLRILRFGQFAALGYKENNNKWLLDINNRYFQATQPQRRIKNVTPTDPKNGFKVLWIHTEFWIKQDVENGWVLAVDLPVSANSFSNKFEHGSGVYPYDQWLRNRGSAGFTGLPNGYWIPIKLRRGNIRLGSS